MASDLTTLTSQLAAMKQSMVDRLTAQGVTGFTVNDTMEDIVTAYNTLRYLDYDNTTITENGIYVAPSGKTGYNNFVVNVPAGGPASHTRFKLFDRVYDDDSGEAIGTVFTFIKDSNNVEYAVVALDAKYRTSLALVTGLSGAPGDISNLTAGTVWTNNKTATEECNALASWCTTNNYVSPALDFCRALSFRVGGQTYYGQIPIVRELMHIRMNHSTLTSLDPTVAENPSNEVTALNSWVSSQRSGAVILHLNSLSASSTTVIAVQAQNYAAASDKIIPVLEIPNAVSNS